MEDPDAYLEESERTRQLILSTCTALGGYEDSISPDGQVQRHYSLGDEALRMLNGHKKLVPALYTYCFPFLHSLFEGSQADYPR